MLPLLKVIKFNFVMNLTSLHLPSQIYTTHFLILAPNTSSHSFLLLPIPSPHFPSTSPILITLIPTRTSLSNIILSTALRTDPSLIAIDRALSVDKFGSSVKRHSCCFR
jgi:hypothetical protein